MDPEPRFAWNGDSTVAYEVVGDGPVDLVYMPGFINNLEVVWDKPLMARFLKRLASFSRLIMIDRRGMGLSDRLSPEDLPPIEELVDDIDAVLDSVGSERAVIFGTSDCGAIAAMYAASHPDRPAGLIVYASSAVGVDPGDYGTASADVAWDEEGWKAFIHDVRTRWRSGGYVEESLGWVDPSIGARVGALAEPSEVLVSQTVRDLVVGSGLAVEDAGEHELKGVPNRWCLYRVVA
jgi:pimeloyl-ACP methyl ester carboxylesterase